MHKWRHGGSGSGPSTYIFKVTLHMQHGVGSWTGLAAIAASKGPRAQPGLNLIRRASPGPHDDLRRSYRELVDEKRNR